MLDEKIRSILEMYPVEVKGVSRGRGAYVCHTSQGVRLLKAYPYSENHLIYESMLKSALIDRGYLNIDDFICNKEGQFLTTGKDGKKYVLKKWFDGQECNLSDRHQVETVVKNLAYLHLAMKDLHFECGWMPYARAVPATALFRRRNRELRAIRSYIRNKKDKNTFELLYMNAYEKYAAQAGAAGDILEQAHYEDFYRASVARGNFCHGDYSHHHVLLGKNFVAAVNFDKSVRNVQIHDLYYFMRKALEKADWDPSFGALILNTYDRARTMTCQEKRCLYALLLYPEKFWKIANHYYNARKSWHSEQNMEKMKKFTAQQEARDAFLSLAQIW